MKLLARLIRWGLNREDEMEKIKKKKNNHLVKKTKKYSGEKLLKILGINEAIDLIEGHAWVCAVNEAIDVAGKGKFGKEIKRIVSKSTASTLTKLLKNEHIEAFINDEFDVWLEMLASIAGPKIAELWNLSESAGERLAATIYWGKRTLESDESLFSPFVFLTNVKGKKEKEILELHKEDFKKRNCIIVSPSKIQEGHIYLDVTGLSYSRFRSSYKIIDLYREYLGIKTKDLQVGAPSSINTEKALESVYLADTGHSPRNITEKLGFKIYHDDNLGQSYPLLRKYQKIGRELEERLNKLDGFLVTYIKSKHGIVA
jgi:hypothetical protein